MDSCPSYVSDLNWVHISVYGTIQCTKTLGRGVGKLSTRVFLRRHLYVYLYVAALCIAGAAMLRWSVERVSSEQRLALRPVLVIDAGHGGIDSGTSSPDGVRESELNLQIAKRLDTLLRLLGQKTRMTRTDSGSIDTEGETIRQKKQSDLRNRLALIQEQKNTVLVSIHQNFYPDSRYSGAQVFYAGNNDQSLAEALQTALNTHLTPGTNRTCKRSEGVYLMRSIQCPGVLVECGFLSNPAEAERLQTADYQRRLCCVLAAALIRHLETGTAI